MKFKATFFGVFCFFISTFSFAQSSYFPPLVGTTWDTISPGSLGWCTPELDSLYKYLDQKNTKAFIILKDGKIVVEKYFGTFTADSTWYWASAGKSLVGFLTGIAQEKNLLSIDDTTATYLGTGWTSCTPTQEKKITIKHQLSMTTGLNDGINLDCTAPTCLQYKSDAGTRWAYHNAPYTLLQDVIATASGTTINDFMLQNVTLKTGISGLFVPFGDLSVFFSKPRNMARFGLLALNRGTWNGTAILQDTNYFNAMTTSSQTLNNSYGYLWWLNGKSSFMLPSTQIVFPGPLLPSAPSDMYAAIGKNGQLINVVPSQNLVLIRMGNVPDSAYVPNYFNDTIWQKLNNVMCQNVGIDEQNFAKKIEIFPNPTKDILHINLANSTFDVRVYSITGEEKQTILGALNELTINCETFANGIYIIQVTDNTGQVYNQRINILH